MIIPYLLYNVLTFTGATENQSFLSTRPGRAQWEATFNETFIQPVTEELDQKIFAAFSSVMNDNEQGNYNIIQWILTHYYNHV